ncbi:hypothetical protein ACFO0S_14600 [Chryseomicrobium palamuruense]|uniref:DUF4179 domain-containing protein n=1 Tax=Chryseomicrobium palamuruense TaxID=682973 RepID=A0ABV8UY86_9BACL
MENELTKLKSAMDQSVFQSATFGEKEKQAIRESLHQRKKKRIPVAGFVAVAALFLLALIGSSVWLQMNQPAAPSDGEPHILEGMIFQGQTNAGDTLQFLDGNLTVSTDPMISAIRPWMDPEDMASDPASELVYPELDVERTDSLFSIYSEEELVFTLTQTGPLLYEDEAGNVYSTQVFIEGADDFTARVEDFKVGYHVGGGVIFGDNENGIHIGMLQIIDSEESYSTVEELLLEIDYDFERGYIEFPDAEILTEGSTYTVILDEEHTLIFEKKGKRIIEDENGIRYYSVPE